MSLGETVSSESALQILGGSGKYSYETYEELWGDREWLDEMLISAYDAVTLFQKLRACLGYLLVLLRKQNNCH